jgi:hypothetical protein
MTSPSPVHMRTVTLGSDTRLEVSGILPEPGQGGGPVINVRLCRRRPGVNPPVFDPTPAGFPVPVHLAAELVYAVQRVAARLHEQMATGASRSSR